MSLQYDPNATRPQPVADTTDWTLVLTALATITLGIALHLDRMDSGDMLVCLITLMWAAKKVFQKV
jgi:hypothetical protein